MSLFFIVAVFLLAFANIVHNLKTPAGALCKVQEVRSFGDFLIPFEIWSYLIVFVKKTALEKYIDEMITIYEVIQVNQSSNKEILDNELKLLLKYVYDEPDT